MSGYSGSSNDSSRSFSPTAMDEDDSIPDGAIVLQLDDTNPVQFLQDPAWINYKFKTDFSQIPVDHKVFEAFIDLFKGYQDFSRCIYQLNQNLIRQRWKDKTLTQSDLFSINKWLYDNCLFICGNIPVRYIQNKVIVENIKQVDQANQKILRCLKYLQNYQQQCIEDLKEKEKNEQSEQSEMESEYEEEEEEEDNRDEEDNNKE